MEAITFIFIILATFLTRIVNLLKIPIFTDEAIYIRWAQIGLADPAHRYISLTDGKQPLLTWLMYPMLKVFSDPLFAGRFVSVIAGVMTVSGVYFLSRELFGKKTAIIASLIYIASPFTLLYDRLALMDSLLAASGIWSLYLSVRLATRIRLDAALLLGISIGIGVLTKSSAWIYMMLAPLSLILVKLDKKFRLFKFGKYFFFIFISFVISQLMYNSLRFSPWFYLIRQKNYSFILTTNEFLREPFKLLIPNLNGLTQILLSYLTIPVFAVWLCGVIWAVYRLEKRSILLFLWFIIPFMGLASFGKVIFPRFILFMVIPVYVLAAFVLFKLSEVFKNYSRLWFIIFISVFIYPAYQSFLLIYSPLDASIHRIDRNQYFEDWPSGYGVQEVISYIDNKAKAGKVVLGTEGTFGLNPAVYEIYLGKNQNVEIEGFWPVNQVPPKLIASAINYPTYLVFKEKQDVPSDWPLKLIARYKRGYGNTYLLFYQVEPAGKNSLK